MMTEVQPETQATDEHVGLWSLVITDGEAYGLSQTQSCYIFNSEDAAYLWAARLLVDHGHATSDEMYFYLNDEQFSTAEEVVKEYQWDLAALDLFHVFPAFNGEYLIAKRKRKKQD